MYNHAPKDYVCPICAGIEDKEKGTLIRESDFFYKDNFVSGLINSFFIEGNEGHAIIVPNQHFENTFDLPDEHSIRIHRLAQMVSSAIRETYNAEGITILQNNEPAGDQHAFHYHLHVFPRYSGDHLHGNINNKRQTTPDQRMSYAEKLKKYFDKIKPLN